MEYLFEAALTGNVELLQKSLQENPFVLTDFELKYPTESLLHIAIKAGQLNFVCELITHKPSLCRELNKDGLRPMDIASIMGNIEIGRELLKINGSEICRLRGKDRRTALHYAAIKGRVEIIDELISKCPRCIEDVTVRGETALHLAVENNQFDAFSVLMKWIESLRMEVIVNYGDCDGNTVLHLAASRKQHEIIELLVDKNNNANSAILEVNARNLKGLTAMDILDIVMEGPNDLKLKEILLREAQNMNSIPNTVQTPHEVDESKKFKNWFKYFKFQVHRYSLSDTRSEILVVAALIATVTFQAGVTPPSGLLRAPTTEPPSSNNVSTTEPPSSNDGTKRSPVVTSGLVTLSGILGSHRAEYFFLFTNTSGFAASLYIIVYLTGGFPLQRELLISICSMVGTYMISIDSLTKENEGFTDLLLVIAFFLPSLVRWLPMLGKIAWKCWLKHNINQDLLETRS